jgi:GTP-dependent dephospho-CoA kinase
MRNLPSRHRSLFKEPFGILFPSIDKILPLLPGKIIFSVGDVVTSNLLMAGYPPDVAIIDGYTMRKPYPGVSIPHYNQINVKNPPGTLTDELIAAIKSAIITLQTVIQVDGEEDLAVVPVALHAPSGSSLLYGQPGDGVVLLEITPEIKVRAEELFSCFEKP